MIFMAQADGISLDLHLHGVFERGVADHPQCQARKDSHVQKTLSQYVGCGQPGDGATVSRCELVKRHDVSHYLVKYYDL
jgi:hypothetical protein